MTITAKIICDSIANGVRLTTLELYYPRYIHSQFMTHRMFSRNASSSRAIPVQKNIDAVFADPAMPIHWGKNKAGMKADEEFDERSIKCFEVDWVDQASKACGLADYFSIKGLHKQIANRLLEPFLHIKVICTATEWENFFKLRLHDDAQPEIQELARCMKQAIDESIPNELTYGEWHMPYVSERDPANVNLSYNLLQKLSVARCARVSYLNHYNSNPDIEKDIALSDRLLAAEHMSPFEHVATPMPYYRDILSCVPQIDSWVQGITHIDRNRELWSGNFKGFLQYRQLVANGHHPVIKADVAV